MQRLRRIFRPEKQQDDFYITLLKYARQKMIEGETVHCSEVCEYVKNLYPSVSVGAIQRTFFRAMEEPLLSTSGASYRSRIETSAPHLLTLDAHTWPKMRCPGRSERRGSGLSLFPVIYSQ